jgi:protein-disulfide isomerase
VGPLLDEVANHYGADASVVFKHYPLNFHKKAQLVAEATMAAHAQGKFFEFAGLAFQNQQKLDRVDLERYAEQLGLNMDKFKEALDSGLYKERVQEDVDLANKVGVRGTPTIFVNGRLYEGPREAPKMIEIIDREILKRTPAAEPAKEAGK